jgi:hypothetical protein
VTLLVASTLAAGIAVAAGSSTPPNCGTSANPCVARNGQGLTLGGAPWFGYGFNVYNANSRDDCWYGLGRSDGTFDAMLSALPPGIEVVRSWYFTTLAGTPSQRDWSAFDRTLAALARRGMKAWFVVSDEWGACDGFSPAARKTRAWYAGGYKQVDPSAGTSYRAYLREVLVRYGTDPRIAAFDLMNEAEAPEDTAGNCNETQARADLQAWVDDVAPFAKTLTRHLITVGTIGGGQCGTEGDGYRLFFDQPALDACDIHPYRGLDATTWSGDQWNGEAVRRTQCAALGKPLIASEMGMLREVSGGTAARASWFDGRLAAWKAAGVDVAMVWNLGIIHRRWDGSDSVPGTYDVITELDPNRRDPLISVVAKY